MQNARHLPALLAALDPQRAAPNAAACPQSFFFLVVLHLGRKVCLHPVLPRTCVCVHVCNTHSVYVYLCAIQTVHICICVWEDVGARTCVRVCTGVRV